MYMRSLYDLIVEYEVYATREKKCKDLYLNFNTIDIPLARVKVILKPENVRDE